MDMFIGLNALFFSGSCFYFFLFFFPLCVCVSFFKCSCILSVVFTIVLGFCLYVLFCLYVYLIPFLFLSFFLCILLISFLFLFFLFLFSLSLYFSLSCGVWFMESWCYSKGSGLYLQVEDPSSGHWSSRELSIPWNINV